MSFKKTILLLTLVLLPLSAFALKLDKGRLILKVNPGQTYTESITLENPSPNEEVTVTVYLEDFKYTDGVEGSKKFFSPATLDTSLADWLTFSPQRIVLPPLSRQKVNLTIKPIGDFKTAHCGVIYFESFMGRSVDDFGRGVNVMGRLGSLIFVQPGDAKKNVTLVDAKGGSGSIILNLKNSGQAFIYSISSFVIVSATASKALFKGQAPELYLMPGDSTALTLDVADKVKPGKYTAVVSLNLGDDEITVKEVDFEMDYSGAIKILAKRD